MNQSNDYSSFGFEPEPSKEYEEYGFSSSPESEPQKTVGVAGSVWPALQEAVLGPPVLLNHWATKGTNAFGKALKGVFGEGDQSPETLEKAKAITGQKQINPIEKHLASLPKSKGEAARRARTGITSIAMGATGGFWGAISGLIGSQAAQSYRELMGKEGEFDKAWPHEFVAGGIDLLTGGASNVIGHAATLPAQAAHAIPNVFREGETALQRGLTKSAIQGDKIALQDTINGFGNQQIREFENAASQIAPNRFTELTNANASNLKQQAEGTYRAAQLQTISPIAVTKEEGGRLLQGRANALFQTNVIEAERAAYGAARQASEGLTGSAPRTIQEAQTLLTNLERNTPTPEQNPVVRFLRSLIEDLETRTAAQAIPERLDQFGITLEPARNTPATRTATVKPANDLVDLVQKANQAVNYESELREQSHRLIPIVNTLREETGQALAQRTAAQHAYRAANELHAANANTWNTDYMRKVRFTENPEDIIKATAKGSNLANFQEAVQNPQVRGIAERLVIEDLTASGGTQANREAMRQIQGHLTPEARIAGNNLINVTDPLTEAGGRTAMRTTILEDAANAVLTGERPSTILTLMETPKGYDLVRQSMQSSAQSRQLFNSFERLFVEDIFNSIMDKTGRIDWTKAKSIIKNNDVRQVIDRIQPGMSTRLTQLEGLANNFERNATMYKQPETKGIVKQIMTKAKNAGLVGYVLHSSGMPPQLLTALGVGYGTLAVSGQAIKSIGNKALSSPRVVRLLEDVSRATTPQTLAKSLPQLIAELNKLDSEEP